MEMERGIRTDRFGHELKTSSEACVSAINEYYYQILSYGRKRSVILEASVHDPNCVLANTLAAHYLFSSYPSRAPSFLEAAESRLEDASLYEKAIFDAISYLVSENRDDDVAIDLHFKLLKDFPKDLVSLKRGQLLAFYMGRPDLFLNLVEHVLPENEEESYIHGVLAFPLLELGRMGEAEEAARKGLEINKQDLWAQHCFCHVLQHECRFKEAVEFMEECSPSWSSCSSFMLTHNWWHVALCYLEGHAPIRRVLEVYDNCIWKELEMPDASCAEVYVNALGLLLRVYVRGENCAFEDRLKTIVGRITDQSTWYLEWHLDMLIIWALACTGEAVKAEELLNGLKSRIAKKSRKKQELMKRGILLTESLYEYGRGNFKQALELLGPEFDVSTCKVIGASDEQLDVFNEVWFSMLLKTGQATHAIEVLEKQINKRNGVPFLWRLLGKAYSLKGSDEAGRVCETAIALETAYLNNWLNILS